jgi:hypothetical protein
MRFPAKTHDVSSPIFPDAIRLCGLHSSYSDSLASEGVACRERSPEGSGESCKRARASCKGYPNEWDAVLRLQQRILKRMLSSNTPDVCSTDERPAS